MDYYPSIYICASEDVSSLQSSNKSNFRCWVCTPQNSVLLWYDAVTMDNQILMFQGKILFSFWRAKMPKNNKSLKRNCVSISLLSHIITPICGAGTHYCEILYSLQLLLSTYIQIFFWAPCSQTPQVLPTGQEIKFPIHMTQEKLQKIQAFMDYMLCHYVNCVQGPENLQTKHLNFL